MQKMAINGAVWGNRKRRDLPLITPRMMHVLLTLRDANAAGYPFIAIVDAHKRTLKSLVNRDWIFASEGLDGTRYKITGRGLRALKIYEPNTNMRDGICPTCRQHPKRVGRNGKQYGYCAECERVYKRRQWKLKGKQLKKGGICPRCKIRDKHVHSTGRVASYCAECRKENAAAERKRKHARLLKRIKDGEVILCIECKKAPRYHTENTVFDYCYTCYRAYQNKRYAKRKQVNT